MPPKEFLKRFVRQCAHAGAWLLGWLSVSERLAPGSVLLYFNLYLLAAIVLLLTLAAPCVERGSRWKTLSLLPVAFLLVAFLFLVTKDLGRWGYLLTASAVALPAAFVGTGAVREKQDDCASSGSCA